MVAKRVTVTVNGRPYTIEFDDVLAPSMTVRVNGKSFVVEVRDGEAAIVQPPGGQPVQPVSESSQSSQGRSSDPPAPPEALPTGKTITAPMPGNILEIFVHPGDEVKPKQDLCMLEAMKMKNVIRSPHHGIIAEVNIQPGRPVSYGEVLFVLR